MLTGEREAKVESIEKKLRKFANWLITLALLIVASAAVFCAVCGTVWIAVKVVMGISAFMGALL